ncbi:MAG: GGDEF domain-containing protein [Calditrichaeota bacterium]|nr:GGDEF domain-containing protein [Calditrichota bacterium]MCB9366246.1 GGDEF domain-containing protein [Calditrichota bacterium]MCB9391685.1 GGDEF domain-containing protein [Calditrichota bacterium]
MKSSIDILAENGIDKQFTIFRASSEELLALEWLIADRKDVTEFSLPGDAAARLFWIAGEELLVAIEPESVSPALFWTAEERHTVAFSCDSSVCKWVDSVCALDLLVARASTTPVTMRLASMQNVWLMYCRTRALESVRSDLRFDREGAEFFDILEERLCNLFQPDHLEIAPSAAEHYWMDHPAGWSWIYASRSDYQWPVPLAADYEQKVLSETSPRFEFKLDAKDFLFPQTSDGTGLRCALIIPLKVRGRRHGLIKMLFARDIIVSDAERKALSILMEGLSLIFERTAELLRIQRMAMIDELTNLFNHRFFLTQLRTEFQRALRYGGTLSLLMIDVDGFKNYNDTYGHQAGNRVLAWVASQIRKTVRDIDVVARYGGEEFALILPEVRAEQGLIVAEKIRKVISAGEGPTDDGGKLAPITISCGVADSKGCKGPEEMIDRADRALYWVKRNGRNLVRLASLEG